MVLCANQGIRDLKRVRAGEGDWGRPHRAGTSHEEIVLLLIRQGEPLKNSSVFRSSSRFPVRVSEASTPRSLCLVDIGKQCGDGGSETSAAASESRTDSVNLFCRGDKTSCL